MTFGQISGFLSRSTARLLALVFVLMLLMFTLTGFLAAAYRREKYYRAEQQFQAGNRLAAAGRHLAAVHQYTEALTLSRDNPRFKFALALALLEAGREREAETYFLELVRDDPAAATPNLMLARNYARQQNIEAATQYYQRAIYGLWTDNPLAHRIDARFELIELLIQERKYLPVQAELLRQLDEIPRDPALMKRVGRLFLASQSYEEARQVFEELTKISPRDPEAYAGLADARFELGRYAPARDAYRQALRLNPADIQSSTQSALVSEILGLDPMRPGLRAAQRLALSRQLLERALVELDPCAARLPEDLRLAIERARQIVARKLRQTASAEIIEANIALAASLYRSGRETCGSPPVPDRALALVLEKLTRE